MRKYGSNYGRSAVAENIVANSAGLGWLQRAKTRSNLHNIRLNPDGGEGGDHVS